MEPVFIVILNYNGEEDTIACIDSLAESKYNPISICIIDNGSEKEKLTVLQSYLHKIQKSFENEQLLSVENIDINKRNLIFISNNENLGFAKGNNIGVRIAQKIGFEYVLLLNNDTLVEPNFLENLISFCTTHSEYVAVTPKICLAQRPNIIWNCGGNLTWYKNRKYYYAGSDIKNTPQTGYSNITFITGCALLFKPKETGLLTEDFFFGEEDFEFSLRMQKQHKKMACINDSIIYHKVGQTFSKSTSLVLNKTKLFYICRFVDIKKYFPCSWKLWIIVNGGYAFFMLWFKYNITIKNNFKFWIEVYSWVKMKNKISKDDFLRIIEKY